MLSIDKMSRTPIYEQVITQIEQHILMGAYAPGDALPSVRSLSVTLGVNPNTLQKAYIELERRGVSVSVPGSGRFVSHDAPLKLRERIEQKAGQLKKLALELINAGISPQALHTAIEQAAAEKGEKA